jgi:hypothetical protein
MSLGLRSSVAGIGIFPVHQVKEGYPFPGCSLLEMPFANDPELEIAG